MLLGCPQCQARVDARVLESHEYALAPDEGGGAEKVTFCICPSCQAPLLGLQQHLEQDEFGDDTWSLPQRAYPPSHQLSLRIPHSVRASLTEARKCFESGCYVAATVMCRRTLEAFCKHHDANGRSLADMIASLHTQGAIDNRLREWADALRLDGNLAAHDPDAVFSQHDAYDLVVFSEAMLDYVFVLTDQFESFKKRRAQRPVKT